MHFEFQSFSFSAILFLFLTFGWHMRDILLLPNKSTHKICFSEQSNSTCTPYMLYIVAMYHSHSSPDPPNNPRGKMSRKYLPCVYLYIPLRKPQTDVHTYDGIFHWYPPKKRKKLIIRTTNTKFLDLPSTEYISQVLTTTRQPPVFHSPGRCSPSYYDIRTFFLRAYRVRSSMIIYIPRYVYTYSV